MIELGIFIGIVVLLARWALYEDMMCKREIPLWKDKMVKECRDIIKRLNSLLVVEDD